eukprot:GEMP01047387.1.p1 GENE.GEMP01047387.1~~GEMP01047387.1.p1  ORF type:complete len:275 (+),score=43.24 GEMP01047387.1:142-966(+)
MMGASKQLAKEPTLCKVQQGSRCRSRSSSRRNITQVANMSTNESKPNDIDVETRRPRKETDDDSAIKDAGRMTPSKIVTDEEDSCTKDADADSISKELTPSKGDSDDLAMKEVLESEEVEVESKSDEDKQEEEEYEDNRAIAMRAIKNPKPCAHKCGYRRQTLTFGEVAAVIGSKKTPAEGMQSYCCQGCKDNGEHTLDCEHVDLATLKRTVYGSVAWNDSMIDYIIVLPRVKKTEKVPVLLFLTGVGHIGWPQGIFNGGEMSMRRFCVKSRRR